MTVHISARLAWHDSGWNGHVCRAPEDNTYCVGQYSFPGEMIAERRNLEWEREHAGEACRSMADVPPCMYSINAFGSDEVRAYSPAPIWFNDGTEVRRWSLPAYTVCTWPYEEMYKDEVLNTEGSPPRYSAEARRQAVSPDKSLVFYYTNYSNPFSEDDQHFYVIVGMSRIRAIGPERTWDKQSREMERRYGPYVWARDITSHYPDQGFRIPYHNYLGQPEVIERILFTPPNPRHFKYATRHLSDDAALELVERASEVVGALQELRDTTENWSVRQEWLQSLMAELWTGRGLYPGLLRVLDYLKFGEAIRYAKDQVQSRGEEAVKNDLFGFLEGQLAEVPGLALDSGRGKVLRKRWSYFEHEQRTLLREVLPRFDLRTDQITRVVELPEQVSVYASPSEIAENPYILAEQYVGNDPDDQVGFSQVDHGLLPSPELGAGPGFEPDNWQRLRALCVDQLQRASQHAFLPAEQVLQGVNHRLSFMPDWKRAQFTIRHVEAEAEGLTGALAYRREKDRLYLYRKDIFNDERALERVLRDLAGRPNIELRFPVTEGNWEVFLTDPTCELAKSYPGEYEEAVKQQVAVCQGIFRRPLSVVCGAAGTGKTTVVRAIIRAVEKGHGAGTSCQLLAPTGKAADRLRAKTGKEACTVHSFLAERGWLNDNLTVRLSGGRRESGIATYVIDESSMLDLSLIGALFRSINWNSVQRLVLVGDPNQLPPIGTGKVFADLIDWLRGDLPESIGELATNMRQIQNRLRGGGIGILDLAEVYVRRDLAENKPADQDAAEEEVLAAVQEGGDISDDLRVLYWATTDELRELLLKTIVEDMETDTGEPLDPNRPDRLWGCFLQDAGGGRFPERGQVISPYRGGLSGVEHLNAVLQESKNGWMLENKGRLGLVTYNDKVIQVRNRPRSNPMRAWNTQIGRNEKIEIYNGEIGYTKVHGYDHKTWTWNEFRLRRFQVVFSRKPAFWVHFESEPDVSDNLELAYAISVHKAQGSEFERVYFVLPKHRKGLLSRELFYTGLTRAQRHCTLLVEEDVAPILSLRRPENSHLIRINSSLFTFRPVPDEFRTMFEWYEEGKIHRSLADYMVRSKSEVIIANILFDHDIPFEYEVPLKAPDGTFYLPDFTIRWRGETWYWEHEGMLYDERYRLRQEMKHKWYRKHGFWDRLIITTEEGGFDSKRVQQILEDRLGLVF
jgi:exodeoxyribonuclease V alpha subunit